ncbi:DUF374 domain-containing protein [Myxococcota bacterium]|nr:DUF374 domain-containing protein [Myxococcota bacterium]
MIWLYRALGWLIAGLVVLLRRTCRVHFVDDPRPALARTGSSYVLALLHAHQATAVLANDEIDLAAMVSRSHEGELLVPSLVVSGVEVVRGSTRTTDRDKGGLAALDRLSLHLGSGKPALLAVDGPKGPRGRVHGGVAELSRRSRAPVIPLVAVASGCWRVESAWDRFQIPRPLTTVTVTFGEILHPGAEESTRNFCQRIGRGLHQLEQSCDPAEARFSETAQEVPGPPNA